MAWDLTQYNANVAAGLIPAGSHLFADDAAFQTLDSSGNVVANSTGAVYSIPAVPDYATPIPEGDPRHSPLTVYVDVDKPSPGQSLQIMTDANGYLVPFATPSGHNRVWVDFGSGRVMLTASDLGDGIDNIQSPGGRAVLYAYDYGYRANGQASSAATNTTAINSAINALGSDGGTVVLPPGYGYITSPGIELKSRVWLKGAGHYASVLQLADNSNCHMLYNHVSTDGTTDPNAMFCGVLDMGLDGRGAHQSGAGPYYGVYLNTNPQGSVGGADLAMDATHLIQNVYVRNTFSDGIYVNGRSDSRILDCKVSFAGGNAFRLAFDTHVIGCVAEKPSLAGFLVTGSSTQLTNCKAYISGQSSTSVNGQTGVPSSGHGYVVTGTGIGEVTLTGCDAQQVSGHGFHITGGVNGVVIAGCTVQEASYSNGTSFVSFNIDNASNCVILGASKTDNNVSSLRVVNGGDRNDITLSHSLVTGQTTLANPISLDSAILNNRVYINGASQNTTTSARITATVVPSGQYVFAGGGQATGTSNTLGINTLRVFPVYIPHPMTLTAIGAEVTAVGDAGSKYRLGVYADTGSFAPGALLLDAGQIAGDSATVQTITTSLALSPGVYWLGGAVQAVTTTQPALRTFTPGPYSLPMSAAPSAGAGTYGYATTNNVTGALPVTFSIASTVGAIPRIHMKAA